MTLPDVLRGPSSAGDWSNSEQIVLFVKRVWGNLGCVTRDETPGARHVEYTVDLTKLHFRGMGDRVPGLLLGGTPAEALHRAKAFYLNQSRFVPTILCASQLIFDTLRAEIPDGSVLLLSPELITENACGESSHGDPLEKLRKLLRQRIGVTRLNPFNTQRPAEGNMLFGREHELQVLRDNPDTSFAIAGPGHIGKTSMLLGYRNDLRRRGDPRCTRVHLVDFYDCPGPMSLAHHIAFRLDNTKTGFRIRHASDLLRLLKTMRSVAGGPLELLLDEVDPYCESPEFQILGEASRRGLVRMILCGRKRLFGMMTRRDSALSSRLEFLRPTPLHKRDTFGLLRRPLNDLGFGIANEANFIETIYRRTGGLPHLIQHYGRHLVSIAHRRDETTIEEEHLEELEESYDNTRYFMNPVQELCGDQSRLLARHLLGLQGRPELTVAEITRIAARAGLVLTHKEIVDLCDDLFIQNILVWHEGRFQVANEALKMAARRMGFLEAS